VIIHWSKVSDNHYASTYVQFLAVYIEDIYLLAVNESVFTGILALQVGAEGLVMGSLNQAQPKSPLPIVCSGLKTLEGRLLFYDEDDPSVCIFLLYIGKMWR